jgi:hypothetical protein
VGESNRTKATSRQEQRDGNPAFLDGIERCIEQRCRILGIVQKSGTEVNVHVNNTAAVLNMSPEELAKLPQDELIRIHRSTLGLPEQFGQSGQACG